MVLIGWDFSFRRAGSTPWPHQACSCQMCHPEEVMLPAAVSTVGCEGPTDLLMGLAPSPWVQQAAGLPGNRKGVV